jgi:hypothetical protein
MGFQWFLTQADQIPTSFKAFYRIGGSITSNMFIFKKWSPISVMHVHPFPRACMGGLMLFLVFVGSVRDGDYTLRNGRHGLVQLEHVVARPV